jgi:hypothetical protein
MVSHGTPQSIIAKIGGSCQVGYVEHRLRFLMGHSWGEPLGWLAGMLVNSLDVW